jgi:MoxR-like ATPase
MEEEQVTVDGKTYPLPEPFIVIATQNPAGAAGTQLLPDSQLDRFAVRLTLGYPAPKDELTMVLHRQGKDPLREVEPVVDAQTLAQMQAQVAQTFVSEEIAKYVVDLMDATRRSPLLVRGASPRATLAVVSMAKAVARLQGRDYVVPKDVREVLCSTVAHRLHPSAQAEGEGKSVAQVLEELLAQVQPPKVG